MGIEPTALAWEARVLPLYDARLNDACTWVQRSHIGKVYLDIQPLRCAKTQQTVDVKKPAVPALLWCFTQGLRN